MIHCFFNVISGRSVRFLFWGHFTMGSRYRSLKTFQHNKKESINFFTLVVIRSIQNLILNIHQSNDQLSLDTMCLIFDKINLGYYNNLQSIPNKEAMKSLKLWIWVKVFLKKIKWHCLRSRPNFEKSNFNYQPKF